MTKLKATIKYTVAPNTGTKMNSWVEEYKAHLVFSFSGPESRRRSLWCLNIVPKFVLPCFSSKIICVTACIDSTACRVGTILPFLVYCIKIFHCLRVHVSGLLYLRSRQLQLSIRRGIFNLKYKYSLVNLDRFSEFKSFHPLYCSIFVFLYEKKYICQDILQPPCYELINRYTHTWAIDH